MVGSMIAYLLSEFAARSSKMCCQTLRLAQRLHCVGADGLLPRMAADRLIADTAFGAGARVHEPLAAAGKAAVIPPRN
jgi:tetratricopeptide (TPR) repeat protein